MASVDTRQVALVQRSFAGVVPQLDHFSHVFYERLFEMTPRIEHMFRGDRKEQEMRLGGMIRTIVDGLDDGAAIEGMVRGLGWRHVEYGVRKVDYTAFGDALIWTLEKFLGEAFDGETRAAWEAFYRWLSDTMQGR